MTRIIEGIIKFHIVYMVFGVMGVFLIYASADLKCLVQTGESFFQMLIHASDTVSEEEAVNAVLNFLLIAFESVPGDTFFDAVLGISFDSNVGADITSLIIDLFQSGETMSTLAKNLQSYDMFWRDMAVASCASMVLYAVSHLKDKLAGKGIAALLGFALASVFWIFAGYTFGETLTYALEKIVGSGNLTALYIIITVTAVLLEALIHAYGGKCSVLRLVALLCLKIFLNLLRNAFVLYICKMLVSSLGVRDTFSLETIYLNIFGVLVSIGVVFCTILIEAKVSKWSEKVIE